MPFVSVSGENEKWAFHKGYVYRYREMKCSVCTDTLGKSGRKEQG